MSVSAVRVRAPYDGQSECVARNCVENCFAITYLWSAMRRCYNLQCNTPFSPCHCCAERLEGRRHEAEQARTAGRSRRRRDGCEALEGCIQPQADRAVSGERMTSLTPDGRAVAGGAPPERTKKAQTLTECAGRGMPPPLAEPASRGGLHGDGRDPERNLTIAERGADAARRPYATAGEVAAAFPAY